MIKRHERGNTGRCTLQNFFGHPASAFRTCRANMEDVCLPACVRACVQAPTDSRKHWPVNLIYLGVSLEFADLHHLHRAFRGVELNLSQQLSESEFRPAERREAEKKTVEPMTQQIKKYAGLKRRSQKKPRNTNGFCCIHGNGNNGTFVKKVCTRRVVNPGRPNGGLSQLVIRLAKFFAHQQGHQLVLETPTWRSTSSFFSVSTSAEICRCC